MRAIRNGASNVHRFISFIALLHAPHSLALLVVVCLTKASPTQMTRYSFVVVLVLVSVSLVALFHSVTAFNAAEATIAQIEAEIDSGRLTCQQVIQLFLDRIAAYDQQGPKLNAIIALNQQAIAQAQQLDKAGRQGRSLFCVPVALKDNIDMPGYPTAAASIALNTTYPTSPALLLKRLTDAGAIVIAKVNMAELAFDGMNTNSSLGGQTLNAYNFAYTPMGSSGGIWPRDNVSTCRVHYIDDRSPCVNRNGNGDRCLVRCHWHRIRYQRLDPESIECAESRWIAIDPRLDQQHRSVPVA